MFDIILVEHLIGENEYFMRTKVVIKNKMRFIISLLLIVTLIVGIFMMSVGEGKELGFDKNINWVYVKVKEGDTLWSISKNFVDQTIDIRDYVYFIRKINNLKTGYIYPGQVLRFVGLKDYKLLCEK